MKPTKKAPAPKTPAKKLAGAKPGPAKAAAKPSAKPSAKPGAQPGAAPKTPAREWVALVAAHAKAKPGDNELPGYKIKALPEGTRLSAVLAEEADDHWRIKDGVIEGKPLPRNIKILEKAEWRLLPLDDEPAAAIAAPEAAATPATPPAEASAAPAQDSPAAAAQLKLCLRGTGLLQQSLKKQFTVVVEGAFTFQNWGIFPVARAVAVHDEAASPAGRALLEKLPGMPANRFVSEINSGGADVYVLSFASEIYSSLFRSKSTGMVLPLSVAFMSTLSAGKTPYAAIAGKAAAAGVTEESWDFLQSEFEYVGSLNETLLDEDLNTMFALLRGKTVIVLMLNTTVGNGARLLALHEKINAVVRPLVESYGLHTIETNEFVRSKNDLVQPDSNGAMFKPQIYAQIAARVTEIIGDRAIA